MNRVVLCGRLTARPKSSYTPTGIAVAHFGLLISHEGSAEASLVIPCFALRELAQEFSDWGERGHRVNLEGRLRALPFDPRLASGYFPMCVMVDAAYFVDPVADPALRVDPLVTPADPSDGDAGNGDAVGVVPARSGT